MSGEFSEASVPDQSGKTILITGSNSGIGWEAARVLAARGAHVVMACRSVPKAQEAAGRIRKLSPEAKLEISKLDLASLASVRAFAAEFQSKHDKLDLLINNAGLMALPYGKTEDGFEMQIGVNHFGHFALTGLLLETIARSAPARIVNVASQAHRMGKMHWDDMDFARGYNKWTAYGQSKLANLLFTFELQRRLEQKKPGLSALACHPGYAATELQGKGSQMAGGTFDGLVMRWGNGLLAQSSAGGALPTLRAATDPSAAGGDYYGPKGVMEMTGAPVKVGTTKLARDEQSARRLWDESVRRTGVDFAGL